MKTYNFLGLYKPELVEVLMFRYTLCYNSRAMRKNQHLTELVDVSLHVDASQHIFALFGVVIMKYDEPLEKYGTLSKEEMLASLIQCIENSDDVFMFIDLDGSIAYINKTYCDYLGVDQDSVIGRPITDIIPNSKMPEITRRLNYSEKTIIHKVPFEQFVDKEQFMVVNRSNVIFKGKAIGAAGQGKKIREALHLSDEINQAFAELNYYRNTQHNADSGFVSFQSIIGGSEELSKAREQAKQAARSEFDILITGETGVGKEVFANAIHYASSRRLKPIIRVNCASIPAELIESELFGYEEGAFTGAKKGGKKGKFELANGGTLFLDEIGELPLYMQAKLLRVIQEREIERVGGTEPIPLDIRIIYATNRNLAEEVRKKRFRQDLFYRLNVISLNIPPLRSRKEDVPLMAQFVIDDINASWHTDVRLSPEFLNALTEYDWPGNVRELKNVLIRCYAMRQGDIITETELPSDITLAGMTREIQNTKGQSLQDMMDQLEKKIILSNLSLFHGNIQRTAKALGIHRTTLYKKMDALSITKEDYA